MQSEKKKTKGKRAKRKKEFPDVDEEIESILLKGKGEKLFLACCCKKRGGGR